ncbi:MAG TPA: hypothetical protein VJC11_01955 [Patescibacteria group bacterium]|nr:hypothetical protein [Patescibacteria group bacterium]
MTGGATATGFARTLCVEKSAGLAPDQIDLVALIFEARFQDLPVRWAYLSVSQDGDAVFVRIYDDAHITCAKESGDTFEEALGFLAKSDWNACSQEPQKPERSPPSPTNLISILYVHHSGHFGAVVFSFFGISFFGIDNRAAFMIVFTHQNVLFFFKNIGAVSARLFTQHSDKEGWT